LAMSSPASLAGSLSSSTENISRPVSPDQGRHSFYYQQQIQQNSIRAI
jgi:hypothetical protein